MAETTDTSDRKLSILMDVVIASSVGLFAGLAAWLWLGTAESLAVLSAITGLATCL